MYIQTYNYRLILASFELPKVIKINTCRQVNVSSHYMFP